MEEDADFKTQAAPLFFFFSVLSIEKKLVVVDFIASLNRKTFSYLSLFLMTITE